MPIRLNLATRPYLNRRAVRLWLLLASVGLLLILGLNLNYAYQNYRQYRQVGAHLQELERRIADVEGVARQEYSPAAYTRAVERVTVLNQVLEADQFRWTGLLSRLEELVPADVRITSLQPDFQARSLQVRAVSRDVEGMTDFLDALLHSEDLSQVFIERHQEQEIAQESGLKQQVVAFSLRIEEAF